MTDLVLLGVNLLVQASGDVDQIVLTVSEPLVGSIKGILEGRHAEDEAALAINFRKTLVANSVTNGDEALILKIVDHLAIKSSPVNVDGTRGNLDVLFDGTARLGILLGNLMLAITIQLSQEPPGEGNNTGLATDLLEEANIATTISLAFFRLNQVTSIDHDGQVLHLAGLDGTGDDADHVAGDLTTNSQSNIELVHTLAIDVTSPAVILALS